MGESWHGTCVLSQDLVKIAKVEGWRDGSLGEALAVQVQRCELDPQKYGEKSGMVAYARNPSTGEAETGGSLGLTGQPVC